MSTRAYSTRMYGAYIPVDAASYDWDRLKAFLGENREFLSEPLRSSVGPDMEPEDVMDAVNGYEDEDGSWAGMASVLADVMNRSQMKTGVRPVVPVSAAAEDGAMGNAGIGVVPEESYPWTRDSGAFRHSRGLTAEKAELVISSWVRELTGEKPSVWYIDVVSYG